MTILRTLTNDVILIRSVLCVYWENHCFSLMETINHCDYKTKTNKHSQVDVASKNKNKMRIGNTAINVGTVSIFPLLE